MLIRVPLKPESVWCGSPVVEKTNIQIKKKVKKKSVKKQRGFKIFPLVVHVFGSATEVLSGLLAVPHTLNKSSCMEK
jgi:hypothetical protein